MKDRIYTILEIMFIAIFIFSAYELYTIYRGYVEGDKIYAESAETYVEADENAENSSVKWFDFTVDISALKQDNPEAIGWIYIENTPISYPVLQTSDNNYYLKRTYNHKHSAFGSIFVDYRCSADLNDKNTIIYGHNTRNGSMFGSLKEYKNESYLKEHPFIYMICEDATYKYSIFSMFTTTTVNRVYRLNFETDEAYKHWIQNVKKSSLIDTGEYVPTGDEKIITLSTCTSRTEEERFVVLAMLVDTIENN